MEVVSGKVPEDVEEQIEDEAERVGKTKSKWIADVLQDRIENREVHHRRVRVVELAETMSGAAVITALMTASLAYAGFMPDRMVKSFVALVFLAVVTGVIPYYAKREWGVGGD